MVCGPGLWGQKSENTNSLRFGDVCMKARTTDRENFPGYEQRASMWRLLRLLALDFVPTVAVEGRGVLKGHGQVFPW